MGRRLAAIICAALVMILGGCGAESVEKLAAEPEEIVDDNYLDPQRYPLGGGEREELLSVCGELARLCDGEMAGARTARAEYFPYDEILARGTIDELESLLAEAGYTVINTNDVYPAYAENSDGLVRFMDAVSAGENAQQELVSVTQWRSVNYSLFKYQDGEAWHVCASVSWDGDGEFSISEPYRESVRDWGMVEDEFFYYRIYPFDAHWDACVPVRLHRVDMDLYELGMRYVQPVGYQCVNMFLTDWSAEDHSEMSFNDCFEYLYLMSTGQWLDVESFEYSEERSCCLVPAESFEEIMLSYFDISVQELRDRAMYIAGEEAYPWQPVSSSNLMYFPTVTPEVRAFRENADGSVTIVVDVLCFDEKCFPLYTHELTVTQGEDGEFKYLANELVYVSGHSLPNARPRMGE